MQLKHLGQKSVLPSRPEDAFIECVPNPYTDTDYVARFVCPEFSSLCPVTGAPDFASFIIDYCPGAKLVESKALKLFLGSFRNHGAFHEACTVMIGKRLYEVALPKFMRVTGFWYPRGGISIDVFWQAGELPSGVQLPTVHKSAREFS